MNSLIKFLKTTLVGGSLVVLPVWIIVLLLLKGVKHALGILQPIVELVPKSFIHENFVALVLLLVICFATGLLMKSSLGQRIGRWLKQHLLEPIPGYALVHGLARQFSGNTEEQTFQPALVEIEEALVPAFIVEKHTSGQFIVFVSSSPTPMAGAIYILPPERVHPVDVPLTQAMGSITRWGAGTGRWLDAMLPK